jgi:ATPase family associated with various cellular activities (AAA)
MHSNGALGDRAWPGAAAAIAGELKLPLFTILYDGLIGKLLGETAGRLRLVFDAIALQRGVYFFDEIGLKARHAALAAIGCPCWGGHLKEASQSR